MFVVLKFVFSNCFYQPRKLKHVFSFTSMDALAVGIHKRIINARSCVLIEGSVDGLRKIIISAVPITVRTYDLPQSNQLLVMVQGRIHSAEGCVKQYE